MKILPKGLILLCVPYIYSLCLTLVLFNGLSEINRLLVSNRIVAEAIVNVNDFVRFKTAAARCEIVERYNSDPYFKNFQALADRKMALIDKHLKALAQDNPSLPVPKGIDKKTEKLEPESAFEKDLEEVREILEGDQIDSSFYLIPLRYIGERNTRQVLTIKNSLLEILQSNLLVAPIVAIAMTIFYYVAFMLPVKKASIAAANPEESVSTIGSGINVEKNLKRGNQSGILARGLLIIWLPLVFQLTLSLFFASKLDEVSRQAHQEEMSNRILVTLNEVAANFVSANVYARLYIYAQNPQCHDLWIDFKTRADLMLKEIEEQSKKPEEAKDLKTVRESLENYTVSLAAEAKRLDELSDLDIFEKILSEKLTQKEFEALPASIHAGVIELRNQLKEPQHASLFKPLMDDDPVRVRLIEQQKTVVASLEDECSSSINFLSSTLAIAYILNIVLTTALATFVLTSLISRLEQVSIE